MGLAWARGREAQVDERDTQAEYEEWVTVRSATEAAHA